MSEIFVFGTLQAINKGTLEPCLECEFGQSGSGLLSLYIMRKIVEHVMLDDLPGPYLIGRSIGRETKLIAEMVRQEILIFADLQLHFVRGLITNVPLGVYYSSRYE